MHAMKKASMAILAAGLLPAFAAGAAPRPHHAPEATAPEGASYVDVFYLPSAKLKETSSLGSGDVSGDGFGARGQFAVLPDLALTGEYQETKYDQGVGKISQLRVGAGYLVQQGGLFAEYTDIKDDTNSHIDGYGLHGRLNVEIAPGLRIFGDAGYLLDMRDDQDRKFDGPDLSGGVSFAVNPQLGLFADYRYTRLEGPSSRVLEFNDVRTGVRVTFGG